MSEWTIDTLKEHFESLLSERDKALDLQFKENSRRLDTLNHAHEKAVEVQHTYVTQEKFDDFSSRVNDELAERRGDKSASIRWTAIAVTIAVAVIGFVIVIANILTSH
jgi:type IV secretory pathway TrbF-like protein